jgi:hypothetical protein
MPQSLVQVRSGSFWQMPVPPLASRGSTTAPAPPSVASTPRSKSVGPQKPPGHWALLTHKEPSAAPPLHTDCWQLPPGHSSSRLQGSASLTPPEQARPTSLPRARRRIV